MTSACEKKKKKSEKSRSGTHPVPVGPNRGEGPPQAQRQESIYLGGGAVMFRRVRVPMLNTGHGDDGR